MNRAPNVDALTSPSHLEEIYSTSPIPTNPSQLESGDYDWSERSISPSPLEKTTDPLKYWRTHEQKWPNLAILASRYLAITASSAPVERLFSIADKVLRPERASL